MNSLKSISQSEQLQSRNRESQKFKSSQDLQDRIIVSFQNEIAQQSIKIQELSSEKVAIASKVRLSNNTVERLHSELKTRSAQLRKSQMKFEEFREQIAFDSTSEIVSIEDNEKQIKLELGQLSKKHTELIVNLASLTTEKEFVKFIIEQNENQMNQLEYEISEAIKREELAIEVRNLEIQDIKLKVSGSLSLKDEVENEMSTLMERINTENKLIQEIQDKLRAQGYREESAKPKSVTLGFLFT